MVWIKKGEETEEANQHVHGTWNNKPTFRFNSFQVILYVLFLCHGVRNNHQSASPLEFKLKHSSKVNRFSVFWNNARHLLPFRTEFYTNILYVEKVTAVLVNHWNNICDLVHDLAWSAGAWSLCCGRLAATTTPNFSSVLVKLNQLKPFLCFLRSVGCGSHLELGWIQKLSQL